MGGLKIWDQTIFALSLFYVSQNHTVIRDVGHM